MRLFNFRKAIAGAFFAQGANHAAVCYVEHLATGLFAKAVVDAAGAHAFAQNSAGAVGHIAHLAHALDIHSNGFLILRVLPNRRGRVMSVTFPVMVCSQSLMKRVLST